MHSNCLQTIRELYHEINAELFTVPHVPTNSNIGLSLTILGNNNNNISHNNEIYKITTYYICIITAVSEWESYWQNHQNEH